MASQLSLLRRTLIQTLKLRTSNSNSNSLKSISTFPFLSQEPEISTASDPSPPQSESTVTADHPPPESAIAEPVADPPQPEITVAEPVQTFTIVSTEPPASESVISEPVQNFYTAESTPMEATPLPPNPATGSPLYGENWRSPLPPSPVTGGSGTTSVIPMGFVLHAPNSRVQTMARTLDAKGVADAFADWTASQNWGDMKQLFELWVRSLDKTGKPNKPDVNLFNGYLRAHLMLGASAGELLDLLAGMEDYFVACNTASFNLVLKAMVRDKEIEAVLKLLDRMIQIGKNCAPDDESYNLVLDLLFKSEKIDDALKYLDLLLKSGYALSMLVFTECVQVCTRKGRIDALVSIIDRCKAMDQNKALCPTWNLCNFIADVALKEDNSKLTYHALEFMAKWMARGERTRPPIFLSVDEGLLVSSLGTAARTYDVNLIDASWAILRRSLRSSKVPNPESYLAKIHGLASAGNLRRAFVTLREFETDYENSPKEVQEDLFSPFTSLYPLVVACSKKGFETLDSVYFQLENLNRSDPPYKSIAAINCVVLGCANIWDLDRAYQTFEAITSDFGLTPNIHSFNSLMCAFGKLKKTVEASKVFDHMLGLGVKPNATSYSLLVDAHLINRDQKAALSVVDNMGNAGFEPSKEMLRKIRRRCIREMDYESEDRVESLAKQYNIRLVREIRADMLFNLQYGTEYAPPE